MSLRKKKKSLIGPKASDVLAQQLKEDPELEVEIVAARERRICAMIARLIKGARTHGGMTQSEVAERAGMWPAHISRLESEKGTREPSISVLARVAEAMGYKLDLKLVPLKESA